MYNNEVLYTLAVLLIVISIACMFGNRHGVGLLFATMAIILLVFMAAQPLCDDTSTTTPTTPAAAAPTASPASTPAGVSSPSASELQKKATRTHLGLEYVSVSDDTTREQIKLNGLYGIKGDFRDDTANRKTTMDEGFVEPLQARMEFAKFLTYDASHKKDQFLVQKKDTVNQPHSQHHAPLFR